ncbi:hypothetical protein [Nocardiopsis dassonvillei]|uniref:hypothetical protein n=1 Tax=Nocardiopsis dassonvillei TaxID=2014 RepID=UPI00157C458A|nr:hypothetical protein [Nocardiopsis dassonvillei]
MGFFRKKKTRMQSEASSASRSETFTFRDPELPDGDPRQTLYQFLNQVGLGLAFSGPGPIEQTLREALRLVPALARSAHRGGGFIALDGHSEVTWMPVESPRGSAVLFMVEPEADIERLFEEIVEPFDRVRPPFARDFIVNGSTGAVGLVSIVNGSDVVPVWEVSEFSHLAPSEGFLLLPVSLHREVRTWERIHINLYKRSLRDIDGDQVSAFLSLVNGRPCLATPIGKVEVAGSVDHLAPLTERGPYLLDRRQDSILLARYVPLGSDREQIEQWSQELVDDLATGLAELRRADEPPLPDGPRADSLWERVESAPSGAGKVRAFPWPKQPVDHTCVERVRESMPDGESAFDLLDSVARMLQEARGSGFERVWRAGNEDLLSPAWVTPKSAAFDADSGRVVAAACLTHGAWGLSPAYDLGAIDGRNLSTFADAGHTDGLNLPGTPLYVGSTRTGVLVPFDATLNLISVDLHGASGRIGMLEFLGFSTGAVSVYEPSGERRVLTVVENLIGSEPVRFSGDGSWLMVLGSTESTLVEVTTGRRLSLDVGNAGWWPLADAELLSVVHEDGTAIPRLFSLESNTWTRSFPEITLDVPLLSSFPYLWSPSVSPDGREILVKTPTGVSAEYQREHGAGSHLARVNLETGRGRLLHGAFLNDAQTLERDVEEARWTGRAPTRPIRLHSDLASRTEAPVTEHPHLDPAHWAEEAETVLVLSLNRAIELTGEGRNFSHLLPEILASLAAMARAPAIWERRSEWLIGLQQATNAKVVHREFTGKTAMAWRTYGSAISAVRAGRPELIDPIAASWS